MSEKMTRVDASEISEVTLTVGAAVADTAATDSSPFGYAQQQADDLVDRVNELIDDVTALAAQVAEIRATLVD